MKRFTLLALTFILCISMISCGGGVPSEPQIPEESGDDGSMTEPVSETATMPRELNAMEYTLYTNIFYNDQADMYANQTYTKDGVFTVLHDVYNDCERYYVWGYADETLCCDWQWEFVPSDLENLPEPGSLIQMTGIMVADDSALDGYWYTDTTYTVKENYTGGKGKYDMTTMSPTLTRVQLINMLNDPVGHTGERVVIYGRIETDNRLQHPYYDNAWYMPLDYAGELPAIGTSSVKTTAPHDISVFMLGFPLLSYKKRLT